MAVLARLLRTAICAVLVAQLAGCGAIFYPERRGQRNGRIDAGVAVMDGVGLLLFIIPGVIAFAVDFGTGAIYLPGSSRSSLGAGNIRVVKFDARHCANKDLEQILKNETGKDVRLDNANLEVTRLKSRDEIKGQLAIKESN